MGASTFPPQSCSSRSHPHPQGSQACSAAARRARPAKELWACRSVAARGPLQTPVIAACRFSARRAATSASRAACLKPNISISHSLLNSIVPSRRQLHCSKQTIEPYVSTLFIGILPGVAWPTEKDGHDFNQSDSSIQSETEFCAEQNSVQNRIQCGTNF